MGKEILNTAIEFEKEGIKFYSKALGKIKHEFCREIIHSLIEEENRHIVELTKIYEELKNDNSWPESETTIVEDKLKDIFKKAGNSLNKTVKPSTDEKEFLDLCMASEIKGQELYKKLADEAKNDKEKNFYMILAEEERKHFKYLEQFCNYYWDSGLKMQE